MQGKASGSIGIGRSVQDGKRPGHESTTSKTELRAHITCVAADISWLRSCYLYVGDR